MMVDYIKLQMSSYLKGNIKLYIFKVRLFACLILYYTNNRIIIVGTINLLYFAQATNWYTSKFQIQLIGNIEVLQKIKKDFNSSICLQKLFKLII